ncbi:hypothetical protein GCM10027214_30920 [Stenotrophomonas tumulicola]
MFPFTMLPKRYMDLARLVLIHMLTVSAPLLAGPAHAHPGVDGRNRFVDLVDHPAPEANWDRFYDLEDRLAAGFQAACANEACVPRRFLWPMQLRCSVQAQDGSMAACIWVVAGSDLRVRAAGSIEPDVVVWRCVLPIPPGLGVDAFHAALDVAEPLRVRLPGASASLLQGLRRCLAKPGTAS